MPVLSSYVESLSLNALFRATGFIAPGTVWLALYNTNPTANDTGLEISIGATTNYYRVPIIFGAPSGGVIMNTAQVSFAPANSAWGTISYAGIRDAATGGHLLTFSPLVVSRTINNGDVIQFGIGQIVVSLS